MLHASVSELRNEHQVVLGKRKARSEVALEPAHRLAIEPQHLGGLSTGTRELRLADEQPGLDCLFPGGRTRSPFGGPLRSRRLASCRRGLRRGGNLNLRERPGGKGEEIR